LRYEDGDEPAPEGWFVITPAGQGGPYPASQLARLMEQGSIDWNTPIWREGLKNWRPARRDDVLITAIADARGMGSETRRLDRVNRLFANEEGAEDTRIDIPVSFLEGMRDSSAGEPARPSRMETDSGALELALAQLRAQQAQQIERDREPPSTPLRTGSWSGEVPAGKTSAPERPRSRRTMLLLAAASFAAGAVLTPFLGTRDAGDPPPAVQGVPVTASDAPAAQRAEPQPVPAQAVRATRALPAEQEVLAELERVGPAARGCVEAPAHELEIELYIGGATGEVSKLDVLAPKALKLDRVECVSQALSDLRLVPFSTPELRYRHRYGW